MSDVNVWNKDNLISKNKHRHFPTDMMLRSLFSENYFHGKNKQNEGSVLDIGTLYGNNLVPFQDRKWRCSGTEVTEESVKIAIDSCNALNLECDVRLGFNRELPFEDESFDVLLSLATIHYEESVEKVDQALEEFSRVLKPDGCAIVQTVAPKHDIFKNSQKLEDNVYRLNMPSDIRHGQIFTFFDDPEALITIGTKFFNKIEYARCTEEYPKSCVDVWLLKFSKG